MTAICRTCLKEISEDSVTFHLDSTKSATITVRCKLAHCVPEMDLDAVPNAAICDSCAERLTLAHEFKNKCLETEGRIQSYIEQMGYVLTCIDLRDIVEQSKLFEASKPFVCSSDCISFMQPASNATDSLLNTNSSQEIVASTIYDTNRNPIITSLFDAKQAPKEKTLDIKNLQCDTQNFFAVPKIAQLLASDEKSLKCRQCTYATSSDIDLRSHERNHSSLKLHKCSECDYSAPRRQTLIIHMRKHNVGKLYNCNDCGYGTPYRNTFVQHVKSHVGERPYKCTLCDFSSVYSGALSKHIKMHTNEKLYKCGLCSYRGRLKFDLKVHMRLHTGEKPYKCLLCDYSSSHKTNLAYHMKVHAGEKPYRCKLCQYKSSHKTNLQNHMRTHTGEKPPKYITACKSATAHAKMPTEEKPKPFLCSFCNYSSSTEINLIKHITVHSGEKPCQCFDCTYKADTKVGLGEHISVHTAQKPFMCITCRKVFGNLDNLRLHMKQHLKDSTETFAHSISNSANVSADCQVTPNASLRVGCENEMII